MTTPFYQVNDVYIEYTTSDSSAMDKFLGSNVEIKEPPKPLSVAEYLKETFKGNGKLE